jgi:hypothetical protein
MQLVTPPDARTGGNRASAPHPLKPLTISSATARALLGVGSTKFWELVRDGDIEMVEIGRRKMVKYRSIERLAGLTEVS